MTGVIYVIYMYMFLNVFLIYNLQRLLQYISMNGIITQLVLDHSCHYAIHMNIYGDQLLYMSKIIDTCITHKLYIMAII